MKKVNVLGVNVSNINMNEAILKLLMFLEESKLNMVFTPNPELIMLAKEDVEYRKILNAGSLVVPDGIGVVIGAKILKNPLKERVPGYDLIQGLFEKIKDKDVNVYMLGASKGVAEEAKKNMEKKYKGLKIVGVHDGYFKENEETKLVNEINSLGTDILLVALGAPKQEKFIYRHRYELNAKIAIGVGGSFDVMAGKVKRAPLLFQKLGLEWFHRLITQPKRAKRMLKLPLFLLEVIKSR